ncbi:MAG: carbohydrate binding family 9 domain-containing protein, partial [Hyphomicrobiaceae bacterium]|nr:carbohydrate binding family 9 domain-containing protein [Hyphomicrobiaceae bacterium]
ALYIAARMYDSDPAAISRRLGRRDSYTSSDAFWVSIDSYHDHRTSFIFDANPEGVRSDMVTANDDGHGDDSWDPVWSVATSVDSLGWVVEMKIPFSQLRFSSEEEQIWGINFERSIHRKNEYLRWSWVPNEEEGYTSHFGHLVGIEGVPAPRRLEVLPYAVGTSDYLEGADPRNPFNDGSVYDITAGLDLKYGVTSDLTLDATVNPDFGQVEADPAVVNLTAFETYFQERRPFFVEDARVFDFSLSGGRNSLFYTRRVGRSPHGGDSDGADYVDAPRSTSILGAAKVTGRTTGGLSVGALLSVTQEERADAYFADQNDYRTFRVEPRSTYGVMRVQQDFNQGQSRVGGIFTAMDRSLPEEGVFDHLPSGAYSAGFDFEHSWGNREWALWGFVSGSHVRGDSTAIIGLQRKSNHYWQRPDTEWAELDSTSTSMTGAEWRLQFERRVGHWTGAIWAAEVTSGFEVNDLGFSASPERLDGGFQVAYQEVRPTRLFRNSKVEFVTFHNFSHEVLRQPGYFDRWREGHTAGTARLSSNVQFLNFWTANVGLTYRPDLMSRAATRGGPMMEDPGSVGLALGMGTDNRKFLSVRPSLSFIWGRQDHGDKLNLAMGMTLQPSSRLLITLTPRYDRTSSAAQYVTSTDAVSYEPTFGTRYLFADLERTDLSMVTRVNLTFTPKLSLEFYAQPLISSGNYVTYKQLAEPQTFEFEIFEEGVVAGDGCQGGTTCLDDAGARYVDFDDDANADVTFTDRDFNLRSLTSTAVLRWEYRPGSTFFLVWQHRQVERASVGDFDFGRDFNRMFGAPSDDVSIFKANIWLSL